MDIYGTSMAELSTVSAFGSLVGGVQMFSFCKEGSFVFVVCFFISPRQRKRQRNFVFLPSGASARSKQRSSE